MEDRLTTQDTVWTESDASTSSSTEPSREQFIKRGRPISGGPFHTQPTSSGSSSSLRRRQAARLPSGRSSSSSFRRQTGLHSAQDDRSPPPIGAATIFQICQPITQFGIGNQQQPCRTQLARTRRIQQQPCRTQLVRTRRNQLFNQHRCPFYGHRNAFDHGPNGSPKPSHSDNFRRLLRP